MHVGGRADQRQAVSVEDVAEQGGEIAAVADDGRGEFPPQRVARHDPEVATDIGDDGANRAAATRGAMGMAGECAALFFEGIQA